MDESDRVTASDWSSRPLNVDAEWPYTYDYGLLYLDEDVEGITPAALPEEGLLDTLIGDIGQTAVRFLDVGYGVNGVISDRGPVPRTTHGKAPPPSSPVRASPTGWPPTPAKGAATS